MRKIRTALLVAAAFATSAAWAQQGAPSTAHKGTEAPRGVVTGTTPDGGIALQTDAARTSGEVPTVSGGVSLNARDSMRTMEKNANIKMVFALTTGNYVADVRVKVVDGKGQTVIDEVSNGPWLFAKLRPGSYTATATYNGKAVTEKFSVAKSGMKTATFRWPASVEAVGAADAEAAGGQILGTGPQETR